MGKNLAVRRRASHIKARLAQSIDPAAPLFEKLESRCAPKARCPMAGISWEIPFHPKGLAKKPWI